MYDQATQNIKSKADNFAYITFKVQAAMYKDDKKFYGIKNTVIRINSCVFACASKNVMLLKSAKLGIAHGFDRLKNEQDLPMLSYHTISNVIKCIDKKLKVWSV